MEGGGRDTYPKGDQTRDIGSAIRVRELTDAVKDGK